MFPFFESHYKKLLSSGAQLEAVLSEPCKEVSRVNCCPLVGDRAPKMGNWKADETVSPELYLPLSQLFWSYGTFQTSLLFSSQVSFLDQYLPHLSPHAPIFLARKIWHGEILLSTPRTNIWKEQWCSFGKNPGKGQSGCSTTARAGVLFLGAEDWWRCKWCVHPGGMGRGTL